MNKLDKLLHEACKHRSLSEVKQYLAQGANVNARAHEIDGAMVPLEEAIWADATEIIEVLLSNGADVNAKTCGGKTPLQHAAIKGSEPIVSLLVKAGADMNATDYYGTPLDWAMRLNRIAVIEVLTEHGARPTRA